MNQRFELGRIVATPGALDVLGEHNVSPSELVERHASGNWGEVPAADARENQYSVKHGFRKHGFRILSSYPLGNDGSSAKVWIVTEADKSSTCLLLPSEY